MVFELEKSVHGIKRYDKKTKKNWAFLVNPTFLAENLWIGLIWSKLIEILYIFFEKYSKLNKELELDAKNIIKCSFKELLAFLSKKMTIFDLHMILGKYKKIFQWKPYISLQIRKEHEILYIVVLKECWLLNRKAF